MSAVYVDMSVDIAVAEPFEARYQHAYDRHWDDVFRFVLAWTNDWAAAEDLAQETYLRLWQHREHLDWERPVLPWLLVASRRLATNRFHALRRRILPRQAEPSSDEAIRARWLDVRSAMARLSPLERTALVLTAVEGWSYAEVAAALGTTDGPLRAAVSRARDKLEVA
jgi:RNA polymerase sigma-70 factor (ECF subfamily)